MKYCFSSYNTDINALSLIDVDLQNNYYQVVDKVSLYEPSFCISYKDYIFTYTKNPLHLLCYKIINNKFTLYCRLSLPLMTLTHLYFNSALGILYGASYKDGKVIKARFDEENKCFNDLSILDQQGLCHCVFEGSNNSVYVINIKQDLLYHYDSELNLINKISFDENTGPRHGIYYKNAIYIVSEYSNEVFKIVDNKIIKKSKTIKDNVKSFGGTLFAFNDLIFVSNRGEETIAIFDLELNYIKSYNVYGNHSRHMIFDRDNKIIISCNKNSNQVSIIDVFSGKLLLNIPYEKVSCVCKL